MVESSFLLRRREMRMRIDAMTAIMRMRPAMAIPMAKVLGDKQKVLGSSSTSSLIGDSVSDAPSGSGSCKKDWLVYSCVRVCVCVCSNSGLFLIVLCVVSTYTTKCQLVLAWSD